MKPILLLLSLLLNFPSFCQEEQPAEQKPVHSLGIGIGANDFHFRDEYLSPHIFSKTMFSSRFSFQYQAKLYLHSIDLSYSYGHPNSAVQPRNVKENIGSVAYAISRVIDVEHIAGKPLKLSLGAGISTFIVSTDFVAEDKRYSYEWNEQSWYCSNSVNLHLKSEYQFSKKTCFFMQFTLPVFLLVSRPETGHTFNTENEKVIDHFLNVEVQGKPELFWKNVAFGWEFVYNQQLGSRCNLKLNYLFNYVTTNRPAYLQMYMNHFMVGIEFLF
jgi:hypothetical protein